ncbi:MAG: ABC transporter substrate-binding protein, partial [Chloroflexota bacterium]
FMIVLGVRYYFYLREAEGSSVGIVFPDEGEGEIGLITNATAAAVVQGASNVPAAQAFLDYLVSFEGQQLFAEQNYEYPLLAGVPLREGVQPLEDYRLAAVDIGKASLEFDATFDLMEKVNLP